MTEEGDAGQQRAGVFPGDSDHQGQEGGEGSGGQQKYVTMDDLKSAFAEFAKTDLQKTFQGLVKATDKKVADALAAYEAQSQEQSKAEVETSESAYELALKRQQNELQKMKEQLTQERETRLRATREGSLREFLSDKVSDVGIAMSYFTAQLKVDDAGNYYGEDENGGITSWEDYVQKGIASKPILQKPSGKSGGGGAPRQTEGGGPARRAAHTITKTQYESELDALIAKGDDGEMMKYQQRVMDGEIIVQGIND